MTGKADMDGTKNGAEDGVKDGTPELSLEEAFESLDQIIGRLEDEDISLDESFKAYQSGMELLKYCNRCIDHVEQKIMVINEKGELDEF